MDDDCADEVLASPLAASPADLTGGCCDASTSSACGEAGGDNGLEFLASASDSSDDVIPFRESDYERFERRAASSSPVEARQDAIWPKEEVDVSVREVASSTSSGAFSSDRSSDLQQQQQTVAACVTGKVDSATNGKDDGNMPVIVYAGHGNVTGGEGSGAMRADAKDIGYSTESLSNEDGSGIVVGPKARSSSFEASPSKTARMLVGGQQKQQAWRQSAASCYDTGSNGSLFQSSRGDASESHSAAANMPARTGLADGDEGRVALTYLPAPVPHRHYYCVTNIDRELQDDADLLEQAANARDQVLSESDFSTSFAAGAAVSGAMDASISGALEDGGNSDTSFGASSLSERDDEGDNELESSGIKQQAAGNACLQNLQPVYNGSAFSDTREVTTPQSINKTSSTLEQSPITPRSITRTLGRGSSSESDEFVTALSEWDESMYSPFGSPVFDSRLKLATSSRGHEAVVVGSKPRSCKRLDYMAASDNALNGVAAENDFGLKQSLVYSQTLPSLNIRRDSPVNLRKSASSKRLSKKSAVNGETSFVGSGKTGSVPILHSTPRVKENGINSKTSSVSSSAKRSGRKRVLLSNNGVNASHMTDDKVTDSDAEVIGK